MGPTAKSPACATATINYVDDDANSLTVYGGSGGNTFTVDGTLSNHAVVPTQTNLYTGNGNDTTHVEATYADGPLTIFGQSGQDTVSIGFVGSVAGILGRVFVGNTLGLTNLTVDSSADLVSHDFTLSSTAPTSTLTRLAPADITYTTLDLSSLTINTSNFGNQVMNLGMSGGNPIPSLGPPGLIWNAGAGSTGGSGTHALNIFGELPSGPFASETHNAGDKAVFPQDGQYGSIVFDDGLGAETSRTILWYTGLQPITDTSPAVDYTLNDDGYPDQSFSAVTGPVTGGLQTLEFASTPTRASSTNFETTDIANKNFVTFNTPPQVSGAAGPGVNGVVNAPIPSVGLLGLTFSAPTGGDNNVSFVSVPPGVVSSFSGGADEDATNVTGLGIAAGTVLFVNGANSTNTLNYDAGGQTPTVTPGLLPGEVLISVPGAGVVDAINYQQIDISDVAPIVVTSGPAVSFNGVEGVQLVNQTVGTFTAPVKVRPAPAGLPASDFTASIDWGDESTAAGTITRDASNPSVYYITGTHTFVDNGTYTVANTVAFAGDTFAATVNGVSLSIVLPPAGPTAGTPATANVTQGTLAISALPIAGTEGSPIAAAPIATFIDNGGAEPVSDYSATISLINAAGATVLSVPAASITQNGNAAQFTVNAPAFTVFEEGNYQVFVSVTDTGGAAPLTVSGASMAVIAEAPIVNQAVIGTGGYTYHGCERQNWGLQVVGTFADPAGNDLLADYAASVHWGDGTTSNATITGPNASGVFTVLASHTYANGAGGVYTIATTVTHDTIATVTDSTALVMGASIQKGVLTIVGSQRRRELLD